MYLFYNSFDLRADNFFRKPKWGSIIDSLGFYFRCSFWGFEHWPIKVLINRKYWKWFREKPSQKRQISIAIELITDIDDFTQTHEARTQTQGTNLARLAIPILSKIGWKNIVCTVYTTHRISMQMYSIFYDAKKSLAIFMFSGFRQGCLQDRNFHLNEYAVHLLMSTFTTNVLLQKNSIN